MVTKNMLEDLIVEALNSLEGSASLIAVCRYVWTTYGAELERSGDLLFTWQYDIRWAATRLRKSGVLKQKNYSPRGVWELA